MELLSNEIRKAEIRGEIAMIDATIAMLMEQKRQKQDYLAQLDFNGTQQRNL